MLLRAHAEATMTGIGKDVMWRISRVAGGIIGRIPTDLLRTWCKRVPAECE